MGKGRSNRRRRRLGINLSDTEARILLTSHVSLGKCKPKELWAVSKIDKNGCTSNWPEFKTNYNFLSELLDVTKGKNVLDRQYCKQVDKFLKANSMQWAYSDVEGAVKGLRAMVSTLGAFSRDPAKKFPRTYDSLGALVQKMSPVDFAPDDKAIPKPPNVLDPPRIVDVTELLKHLKKIEE